MKTIKQWAEEVHANAVAHGWWDRVLELTPSQCLEKHMLIVSEIAEATEQVRLGAPGLYFDVNTGKPEGEEVELADAIIRILDYCEFKGIDIEEAIKTKHEYNLSRPFRHGNKLA